MKETNYLEMNFMTENNVKNEKRIEDVKVENKTEEKSMENNQKAIVTAKQRKDYEKCLNVFEKSTKAWIEIAEAYDCLLKLPKELWIGDDIIQNEKRPNVGKFLKAKYDISQGRLSQISGAYDARNQLAQAQIEGYETISCDALYEIYRFAKSKDNKDKMTIKEVYEAVSAKGLVSEKTVKAWRKQVMSATEVVKSKSTKNVFERLLQAFDDVSNANNEEMTEAVKKALAVKCKELLKTIKNANLIKNNLNNDSTSTENSVGNNGEEIKPKTVQIANVA